MVTIKKESSKVILSILIPTYNRLESLINQLTAIKQQMPMDGSVEVVVCDNSQKYQSLPADFDFVNYHFNDENVGLSGNVKKLTNLAAGTYAWFLSDDDKISDNSISDILRNLSNYPSQLIGVCIIEASSSYQGKALQRSVYFTNTTKTYFEDKMEALKETYKALFFISTIIVNVSLAKATLHEIKEINRVYPQTQLLWSMFISDIDFNVLIIKAPLVEDCFGIKYYLKENINIVGVVEYSKLLNWFFLNFGSISHQSPHINVIIKNLKSGLVGKVIRYGSISIYSASINPSLSVIYKRDYLSLLKLGSVGIKVKFFTIIIYLLLTKPEYSVKIYKIFPKEGRIGKRINYHNLKSFYLKIITPFSTGSSSTEY
jgi:hypothetical protein